MKVESLIVQYTNVRLWFESSVFIDSSSYVPPWSSCLSYNILFHRFVEKKKKLFIDTHFLESNAESCWRRAVQGCNIYAWLCWYRIGEFSCRILNLWYLVLAIASSQHFLVGMVICSCVVRNKKIVFGLFLQCFMCSTPMGYSFI